jgi:uncharacterized protein (DUF885 family)
MKKALLLFIMYFSMLQLMATPADEDFNKWKEDFILRLWEMYPGWASSVGYHKYDDRLPAPTAMYREKEKGFCNANLEQLKKFDIKKLSALNKTDYKLIENQLEYTIWGIETQKQYEWDPSAYNVCGGFAEMLANDYEPLDKRLRNFGTKCAQVPAYYEAVKKNIKNPTKEHVTLALEQHEGGVSVFSDDLNQALAKSTLNQTEKDAIYEQAMLAVGAIKDYIRWLKEMENVKHRDFRLGKDLYQSKFGYELQAGYSAFDMYKKALARKAELHDKMWALTYQLWPKYMAGKEIPANKLIAIRQLIDELSKEHVRPEDFQSAIEKQLPKLTDFIKKKNLIYIDPAKPLVVRKEPAYMAGVAGASISAPGPYDKGGNTYYNVGSLEGWEKEKAESYLREYNKYILQILNIHEAIPGHYTQLVYANQSPSIVKAILGNNAMIEGWAVYTELMMLENGYDGDKSANSAEASPEMWLMYYKWNLRSTCNTILDYSVHVQNMSEKEAMDLLVNEAFQQEAEAAGKWRRVSVTQVQLCCYFTGFSEIYDLREELKKKQGSAFNLKKFHETFLSFGSAPVKYIRELMLQ